MTTPESHRNNPKESGSASKKEIPVFDKKTLQALLKVHQENLGSDTGGVMESVSKVLSLSEADITRAITSRVRALREEVGLLLTEVQKFKDKDIRRVSKDAIAEAGAHLNEDTASSLQDLTRWKATLSRELFVHKKSPVTILSKEFEKRDASKQYQEDARILEQVESVFLLDEIARNRQTVVRKTLETTVEGTSAKSTVADIRGKLFDLLSPGKKKKFSAAERFDSLREEIREEREDREYQECVAKVIGAFGRREGLAPFHTMDTIKKVLKNEDEGRVKFILGRMTQEKKIAFMMGNQGEKYYLCGDVNVLEYSADELESTLHPNLYDELGEFITVCSEAHSDGRVTDKLIEEKSPFPLAIATQMLSSFVRRGILKKTQSGYSVNQTVLKTAGLRPGLDLMRLMDGVKQQMEDAVGEGEEATKELLDGLDVHKGTTEKIFLEKIAKRNREYREKRTIKKLQFDFGDTEDIRVMNLANIQFGHAMLDVEFLQDMKKQIDTLTPEHMPNVIVVSSVLYGNYLYQKKKRQRLKTASTNEQYEAVRELFDWLEELHAKHGVKIVYVMSGEDESLVEHYTIGTTIRVARLERERAKGEGETGLLPYWRAEQIKQTSLYRHHFDLQWDVAYPYSIVAGQLTDDGYDLLIDTYKKLRDGKPVDDRAKAVLDIDKIPLPGKRLEEQEIIYTDDFEALLKRAGKKPVTFRGSQSVRATRSSMVTDPMDPMRAVIGHAQSQRKIRQRIGKEPRPDENPPDAWAVYDQNVFSAENVGGEHGVIAYSAGTLRRGQMDLSSYSRGVQDDNMWRAILNRKDCVTPSVTTIGFAADGSRYYDIYNETFNALSQKSESPKRTAVVNISDWQVGSITCAADYLVKMLTMALHTLTRTHDEVILLLNGDLFHGHNYQMAAQEGNPFGMPFPRDQQVFVSDMLENILSKLPRHLKQKIKVVHITDGNHEWNSGEEKYGISYLHPVELIFRHHSDNTYDTFYHKYGLERGRGGIVMKGSMMNEKAGAFNVWMRHYLLEKGMKGSGSNPALQGRKLFPSQGNQTENVDLVPYSHFHNTRVLSVGDKIVAGNGCAAYPSYYESMRAYLSQIGFTYFSVGGGKPVRLTEVTAEALNNYQIPDEAFYSEKQLNKEGYSTDKDWDPVHDSLANTMIPVEVRRSHGRLVAMGADRVMGKASALQKRIADQMHAVMTNLQGRGLPDS